jgi:hypothetical protein
MASTPLLRTAFAKVEARFSFGLNPWGSLLDCRLEARARLGHSWKADARHFAQALKNTIRLPSGVQAAP